MPPAKFRMPGSKTKRRTANNGVRFKKSTSAPAKPKDDGAAPPRKRSNKPKVNTRVTKVDKQADERPKLRTKPEKREPPNPVPTGPRKKREWGKPELGPTSPVDLLSTQEHFTIINHLDNLGSARTPCESALLKKLKRWKKTK